MDLVRSSFDRLAGAPITLSAEGSSALGSVELRVDRLRDLLMDPGLPITTVDAVWVCLVRRSRAESGDATMVCAGMALPVLAAMSARLSPRWTGDRADIEAAVLCGFLTELASIDLDRPWVLHRLRWAAYRAGYACMRERRAAPTPTPWAGAPTRDDTGAREHRLMLPRPGHPELVLADAVAAGVITSAQARLIASTRLERRSLTAVAAERGASYKALQQVRRRAEHKLAAYLTERMRNPDSGGIGEVSHGAVTSPNPTRAHTNRSRRRRREPSRDEASTARPVLKTIPPTGVQGCGDTPAPAHPSSEVRRCA
ncbi:hypothetical protein DMB37_15590 [Nocardia sp. CS682]|nr:hypothetical protein DMB37_15590 [Nocardia sp. CS682]